MLVSEVTYYVSSGTLNPTYLLANTGWHLYAETRYTTHSIASN